MPAWRLFASHSDDGGVLVDQRVRMTFAVWRIRSGAALQLAMR